MRIAILSSLVRNNAIGAAARLFRLAALFFAAALAGCGGGGGGASGVSASAPSISAPPALGSASPVPNQVLGNSGFIDTYGVNDRISTDALYHYFAGRYGSGAKVSDRGVEFLLRDYDALDHETRYSMLRIEEDGAPAFYEYGFNSGVLQVTDISSNDEFEPSLGVVNIEIASGANVAMTIAANRLRVGQLNIDLSGYDYDVFQTDVAFGVDAYLHFIQAEYAAFFKAHNDREYDSSGVPQYAITGSSTSRHGVLTQYANIPASGQVLYQIDHALGAYSDDNAPANAKILHGSGSLYADFAGGMVVLNLQMDGHDGNRFMDITGVEMPVSDSRNEFSTSDCHGSPGASTPDAVECAGNIDYADDSRFNDVNLKDDLSGYARNDGIHIDGEFYGPSGEEIAGGIYIENNDNGMNADIGIGFIGKR